MAEPIEVLLDEWVLRLDGNVVEALHRIGDVHRWHVRDVAVHAAPKGDGLRLRIGHEAVAGQIVGPVLHVPARATGAVTALFDEARARRAALPDTF